MTFAATPIPTDEWTVNGRVVKKSKRIVTSIDESSVVLTIRDIQEKDIGDYNLRLTNLHGEDSIEINVIVVRKYLFIVYQILKRLSMEELIVEKYYEKTSTLIIDTRLLQRCPEHQELPSLSKSPTTVSHFTGNNQIRTDIPRSWNTF